jgi:hypothetical protein
MLLTIYFTACDILGGLLYSIIIVGGITVSVEIVETPSVSKVMCALQYLAPYKYKGNTKTKEPQKE